MLLVREVNRCELGCLKEVFNGPRQAGKDRKRPGVAGLQGSCVTAPLLWAHEDV